MAVMVQLVAWVEMAHLGLVVTQEVSVAPVVMVQLAVQYILED
jgi:hypothetical protein